MFPPPSGLVTLSTDFGDRDPFVGQMKGVILGRFREARIVDLTHGIEPGDVAEGAFWLERSWSWFPRGTVHVAVVDPGVGTLRRGLVAWAHQHWFVGPDNGLLATVLGTAPEPQVRCLDAGRLGLGEPSRTFHGRDVFAPTAAALASGRFGFPAMGALVESWVPSPLPVPRAVADGADGVVVTIDRFGNLITNLGADILGPVARLTVRIGSHVLPVVGTYGDGPPAGLVALIDSMGRLEIACPGGNAAQVLGLGKGTEVQVRNVREAR